MAHYQLNLKRFAQIINLLNFDIFLRNFNLNMTKEINEPVGLENGKFGVLLYKWRKTLIIVALLAIVFSFIFSAPFFITPLYKSTVILFPTSTSSISKALLSEKASGEKDILEFGEDEQTERMLQILNSNRIRDKIISKYKLMEHYNIDTAGRYSTTRLYNQYEDNINFRRTEYMAVKITVYDHSPEFAANIANDIANLVDSTINNIQKKRALKAFEIVEGEYLQLKNEINEMQDSLHALMREGVHDYESQAEMINRQLAIEIAKGNSQAVRRLENKLKTLANYGGAYVTLINSIEYSVEQLSLLRAKYKEAKVDAEEVLPQKFVVDRAYEAERKSYPIRWLIVVISMISAVLLAMFVIVMVENYSRVRYYSNIMNSRKTKA